MKLHSDSRTFNRTQERSPGCLNLKQLIERIALQRQEEFPFPDNLESYLEDFVPNVLCKSETLQQAFGVTSYEMEGIYHEAYEYYESGRYEDALISFRWLVLLNPFKVDYWMGMGANQQLLTHYEKALHHYAIATLLDSENPLPHYYAYACYCARIDEENAQKALALALELTADKPEHATLRKTIQNAWDAYRK